MREKLLIIGAGELGKQIFSINEESKNYDVVGFLDDFKKDRTFMNLPILGGLSALEDLRQRGVFDKIMIGIGYDHLKIRDVLHQKFKEIPFGSVVHPRATVESTATVGSGSVIYPMAYIGHGCILEENSLINVGAILSHDIVIGRSSFISCSACFGGFSSIGKRCFIGLNSTISNNIEMTDDVFLGAFSSVTKSISKSGVYYGNPAKVQKSK